MEKIEFFYDFASPYSYLAATQIEGVAKRCEAEVIWKPFGLGFLFKAVGNQMPASLPPKAAYMIKDLALWAEYYNVPYKWPSIFPINSIAALRAVLAVEDQAKLKKFSLAIYEAFWANNKDISQKEIIAEIADQTGLDGKAIIEATADQKVKDRLKDNTDEAVKRGAFGAPTIYAGDHMFWGNDRLEMLEYYLKKKK
jgi:2-hydroxychromene-2-carboxylate isomerase